jgi:gluconate 2-dehydrogenase gamma chain
MSKLSRRDLLKLTGTAAIAPAASASAREPVEASLDGTSPVPGAVQREPLQALTASEADVLDAVVARLIPSDANGPGATEANAVRYIDRALAGALASAREAYRVGLAALERYSRSSRGRPFLELSPTEQDSVLIDVETGSATGANAGFQGSSAQFFNLVRSHTWQGTFGDPYYGGNVNFVGWDLLGVRTYVTLEEQRLNVVVKPNHKSAYDDPMFNKATAGTRRPRGDRHGN